MKIGHPRKQEMHFNVQAARYAGIETTFGLISMKEVFSLHRKH